MPIASHYGIPVLEDAAEALGSSAQRGNKTWCTFGEFAALSFDGNKMMTTSGGGALVCLDQEQAKRTMFDATQARENAPHYQQRTYRLGNLPHE